MEIGEGKITTGRVRYGGYGIYGVYPYKYLKDEYVSVFPF